MIFFKNTPYYYIDFHWRRKWLKTNYWNNLISITLVIVGFPGGSDRKESACHARVAGSIPGTGRFLGEGNGNPLQCSYLEYSMDRGAWRATVHRAAESLTQLSDFCTHWAKTWVLWDWAKQISRRRAFFKEATAKAKDPRWELIWGVQGRVSRALLFEEDWWGEQFKKKKKKGCVRCA